MEQELRLAASDHEVRQSEAAPSVVDRSSFSADGLEVQDLHGVERSFAQRRRTPRSRGGWSKRESSSTVSAMTALQRQVGATYVQYRE